MDIYEEMLLQIVEVLKKHNRPIPDITHKEAIEEIRSIILGNTTHAEKVTPDDLKKLDNTYSSDVYACYKCTHLIFKDYKRLSGRCSITGLDHNFEDKCDHIEDMN